MKIYLAGSGTNNPQDIEWECAIKRRLLTFWERPKLSGHYIKKDLFIDSGAYSAWSRDKVIDVKEYAEFLNKNKEYISIAANLDVIGNSKASWKNLRTLNSLGARTLPVFHYGEDIKWLERVLSKGHTHICLGGMVPISTNKLVSWLDSLFSKHLQDIKVHGFGLTTQTLLRRYPWYSVDSTSWVLTSAMGAIIIPDLSEGTPNYDKNAWKIDVSYKSPFLKKKGGHLQTQPPLIKKRIEQYLDSKGIVLGHNSGVEIIEEGISNCYKQRHIVNVNYYKDLEKHFKKNPVQFNPGRNQTTFF